MSWRTCCLSLLLLLAPAAAGAHGGLPLSTAILWRGESIYLPTQYWGIFVRPGPEGTPWRWICDEAINSYMLRQVRLGGDGTLYATDVLGMTISRDGGCSWDKVQGDLAMDDISALVPDPVQPARVWATALVGGQNVLYRSDDAGKTWKAGFTVPGQGERGMAISADGKRLYFTSISLGTGAAPQLYTSQDGGATVDAGAAITPHPDALSAVPIFVDPRQPETVYLVFPDDPAQTPQTLVRASRAQAGSGAFTFTQVLQVNQPIFSMALDTGRNRLFIATGAAPMPQHGGLYYQDSGMPAPVNVGGLSRAQCVSPHDGQVYACSWDYIPDMAAVARSGDGTGGFSKVFQYADTVGLLSCPPHTGAGEICPQVWATYAEQLGINTGPSDGGAAPGPGNHPGCQCAAGAHARGCGVLSAAFLGLLAWMALRVRARRSRAEARAAAVRPAATPAGVRSL